MPRSLIRAALLSTLLTAIPALAQSTAIAVKADLADEAESISVNRLAAGIREYPAVVLRCLIQLAEQPLLLRQLADEPGLLEHPEAINPPVSDESLRAIKQLSAMPAIVAVAADHPLELRQLRQQYAAAPEQMEERIFQLRAAYDHAGLGAATNWQQSLENNPAALDEYRALITDFCRAQQKAAPDYPCVKVTGREYYYACPPNEAIVLYAIDNAASSGIRRVIEQWWATNAPYELDTRILDSDAPAIDFELTPGIITAMSPERRTALWEPLEGRPDGAVDLVPVIMQPPGDLPPEACYALAVAEHARLWTAEVLPETYEDEFDGQSLDSITLPLSDDTADYIAIDEEPDTYVTSQNRSYQDNLWDYDADWEYNPTSPTRVQYRSYHTYYSPLAVYYRGYPIDWPLFYGCDPGWLVRLGVCATYCQAGAGISVCFNSVGQRCSYYDYSPRCAPFEVVRIGRRHYRHYTRNQTVHALRQYHTRHLRPSSYRDFRTSPARFSLHSGRTYHRIPAPFHSGRETNHLPIQRPANPPPHRITVRHGNTPGRHTINSQQRPAPVEPRTHRPPHGSGLTRHLPRVSSRRPLSSIPTRNITPHPRTSPKPRSMGGTRRPGTPQRKTSAASPPRTSPSPKRTVAPRPHQSPKPKRAMTPQRGNKAGKSSAGVPHRPPSRKSKSISAPRHPSRPPRKTSASATRHQPPRAKNKAGRSPSSRAHHSGKRPTHR